MKLSKEFDWWCAKVSLGKHGKKQFYICVCVYIYMRIYRCMCVNVCVYIGVCVNACVYMYVCIYRYMCECVYRCIYTHIHISLSQNKGVALFAFDLKQTTLFSSNSVLQAWGNKPPKIVFVMLPILLQ